jgi:tRNA(Ile)-lysidine synthase
MAPLGPWDAARRVAVAVSGGADSLALAVLAAGWGTPLALVVDHGMRAASAGEAALTLRRLRGRGIAARLLRLDVPAGAGAAARARDARYAALLAACAAEGLADLLLGHHALDQAETVLLRAGHASTAAGLSGMAAIELRPAARLLRPLLGLAPQRLRATLHAAGLDWVEDPSNQDPRAERVRLRRLLLEAERHGRAVATLCAAAAHFARRRAAAEAEVAAELADQAELRPDGFALLRPGTPSAAALAALIQMVSGAPYPPPSAMVRRLLPDLRPATLAGVRLLPAGRLGPGTLIVREFAACAPPVTADALWDGRFRLTTHAPPGHTLGALGADAARLRHTSPLPACVLQTLPALRHNGALVAVPHPGGDARFAPARAASK